MHTVKCFLVGKAEREVSGRKRVGGSDRVGYRGNMRRKAESLGKLSADPHFSGWY